MFLFKPTTLEEDPKNSKVGVIDLTRSILTGCAQLLCDDRMRLTELFVGDGLTLGDVVRRKMRTISDTLTADGGNSLQASYTHSVDSGETDLSESVLLTPLDQLVGTGETINPVKIGYLLENLSLIVNHILDDGIQQIDQEGIKGLRNTGEKILRLVQGIQMSGQATRNEVFLSEISSIYEELDEIVSLLQRPENKADVPTYNIPHWVDGDLGRQFTNHGVFEMIKKGVTQVQAPVYKSVIDKETPEARPLSMVQNFNQLVGIPKDIEDFVYGILSHFENRFRVVSSGNHICKEGEAILAIGNAQIDSRGGTVIAAGEGVVIRGQGEFIDLASKSIFTDETKEQVNIFRDDSSSKSSVSENVSPRGLQFLQVLSEVSDTLGESSPDGECCEALLTNYKKIKRDNSSGPKVTLLISAEQKKLCDRILGELTSPKGIFHKLIVGTGLLSEDQLCQHTEGFDERYIMQMLNNNPNLTVDAGGSFSDSIDYIIGVIDAIVSRYGNTISINKNWVMSHLFSGSIDRYGKTYYLDQQERLLKYQIDGIFGFTPGFDPLRGGMVAKEEMERYYDPDFVDGMGELNYKNLTFPQPENSQTNSSNTATSQPHRQGEHGSVGSVVL